MKRMIKSSGNIPKSYTYKGYTIYNYGSCCKVYKDGNLITECSTDAEAEEFIDDLVE